MDLFLGWITQYGYVALFALLMFGIVGLPVPDETLLMFAGYLTFKHELAAVPTVAAAFLGSVVGISLSYGVGRMCGRYLLRAVHPPFGLDAVRLNAAQAWYRRRGKYALLFGYFVPGVRHVTAFVAGSSRLPLKLFGLFAYSGAFLWSVSFIALGYVLGEEWARLSGPIHRALVVIAAAAFAGLGVVWLVKRRPSHAE
jgi:membrane protein DedA with SNARE-associated domain